MGKKISTALIGGLVAAVGGTIGGVGPATAAGPVAVPGPSGYQSVAKGLDNPRHLSFDGDTLYIAEAGRGGPDPCLLGGEGTVCYGLTGAVTRVTAAGKQDRVLGKLPSVAQPGGSGASGPADIEVRDGQYTLSLGLGANPAQRYYLTGVGRQLGTVQRGALPGPRRLIGDLAFHEAENDPDMSGPDTNPGGLTTLGTDTYVADAGGNTVMKLPASGLPSPLVVLPHTWAEAPPFLGHPPGYRIPMEAVPTSVAVGPDGALYISQLTGFPFPHRAASIYRVVPGERPTIYASGLTNVTDLAWHNGSLYAVQLANEGLLAYGDARPTGSLVRIVDGGPQAASRNLPAPYGLAFRGDSAYVSLCPMCAGSGQVVKIPVS